MRLLRLLSLEFFVPAQVRHPLRQRACDRQCKRAFCCVFQYELQGHIASGAYGSVMAAFAARDSPAAARLSIINAITRAAGNVGGSASTVSGRPLSLDQTSRSLQPLLKSTMSLQLMSSRSPFDAMAAGPGGKGALPAGSPLAATWLRGPSGVPGAPSPSPSVTGSPDEEAAHGYGASAVAGIGGGGGGGLGGGGAPMAAALRLALPTDDDGGREARKSAAGEMTVAVKVRM
jgi:hypothetical protein